MHEYDNWYCKWQRTVYCKHILTVILYRAGSRVAQVSHCTDYSGTYSKVGMYVHVRASLGLVEFGGPLPTWYKRL